MCKQSKRKAAAKKNPEEAPDAISGIHLGSDPEPPPEPSPPRPSEYPHRLRYMAWRLGYAKLRRWSR